MDALITFTICEITASIVLIISTIEIIKARDVALLDVILDPHISYAERSAQCEQIYNNAKSELIAIVGRYGALIIVIGLCYLLSK